MATRLHRAVLDNAFSLVEQLMDHHDQDPNVEDENGCTPLFFAANRGALECLDALISGGASAHATNKKGLTPLHFAALAAQVEATKRLLAAHADVNLADNNGYLPIHYACRKGSVAVVRLLLRRGSLVGSRSKDGQTPLHFASAFGHLDCVTLLLQCGASREVASLAGLRPADLARHNKHSAVLAELATFMLPRTQGRIRCYLRNKTYRAFLVPYSCTLSQVTAMLAQKLAETTLDHSRDDAFKVMLELDGEPPVEMPLDQAPLPLMSVWDEDARLAGGSDEQCFVFYRDQTAPKSPQTRLRAETQSLPLRAPQPAGAAGGALGSLRNKPPSMPPPKPPNLSAEGSPTHSPRTLAGSFRKRLGSLSRRRSNTLGQAQGRPPSGMLAAGARPSSGTPAMGDASLSSLSGSSLNISADSLPGSHLSPEEAEEAAERAHQAAGISSEAVADQLQQMIATLESSINEADVEYEDSDDDDEEAAGEEEQFESGDFLPEPPQAVTDGGFGVDDEDDIDPIDRINANLSRVIQTLDSSISHT